MTAPNSPAADRPRLIEVAFPLKQASLDSVHEKNVRHGHISTLHIWPARRPLAASRAALIATLLPDPGTPAARRKLVERIGGRIVERKTKDGVKEETEGGILHWGRESNPDLQWFRDEIRKAYGGRAPRVLDPFAGGGAIPLEAMRLGCEVTAVDINPVAWFILKCTLEYPQRLPGQTRPLPDFIRQDRDFIEAFFKARGLKGKALRAQVDRIIKQEHALTGQLEGMESPDDLPEADLAWHVRAWGAWVLERARKDLAQYYPMVDGKPTVAYLWARTVTCKSCRATIPLLKTRWLCKKENKRVALTMEPNAEKTGVVFGIQTDVPQGKGSAAQKREHDKTIGGGTMSKSGATCPCCGAIMTSEDLQLEGKAGRLGTVMTVVVTDDKKGKEYRLPTDNERYISESTIHAIDDAFADIPFGVPMESIPEGGSRTSGGSSFTTHLYGQTHWADVFTPRQLLALGTFVKQTRAAREAVAHESYPPEWVEAIILYMSCVIGKLCDYENSMCSWYTQNEQISHLFNQFALRIKWDFAEASPIGGASGSWRSMLNSVCKAIDTAMSLPQDMPPPRVKWSSATHAQENTLDAVVTDPPYYDAIQYSDLMDFFYVWLRRALHGLFSEIDGIFASDLTPKWDHEQSDGELIDEASRFGGDKTKSKSTYEEGMERAFRQCHDALAPDGRLVIVFAHKQPDAWETLVSAIIRAGFVVHGSWPIQTEMSNRARALSAASLSSSVWLVCRKRPETARPGWDNVVLDDMRDNIISKLRDFWDAGIRGPDFVWAATGPALEAYSKYPVVKKANEPGEIMTVSEFLAQARRIVVEFVVGRVLSQDGDEDAPNLDDLTTYYLLHRHDFGMKAAPVGPCILYAVSCGLRDSDLAGRYDLLSKGKSSASTTSDEDDAGEDAEDDGEGEAEESSGGATVKLKPWNQRKRVGLAADGEGRAVPLIDRTHRLMHLWRAGDVAAVDDYLDTHGLWRSPLFHHLLQALIELSVAGSEERSLLESISNHVNARGPSDTKIEQPALLGEG